MIIGVTGFIGSGKDTVANYLTTFHGFKKLSFAGSLKDAVSNVFGWDRELLEGTTKSSREWREQVDPWWANRLDIPHLTPRWVLQNWGTEVCRNGFHNDIWVASVQNKLRQATDDIVITLDATNIFGDNFNDYFGDATLFNRDTVRFAKTLSAGVRASF